MIGFIGGTGAQGIALAARFAYAGEKVTIGSRHPERAKSAEIKIKKLVKNAKVYGESNVIAAEKCRILFATVPYTHCCSALKELKDEVKNKIIVDVTNPLWKFNQKIEISASEEIQKLLLGSKVVCAFKTLSSASLLNFKKRVEAHSLVCSDHEDAKREVIKLSKKIGIESIDLGELKNAVIAERLTTLLLLLNKKHDAESGIRITGL